MARPSKLNKDVQARIVEFLKSGAYIETAAKAAGIGKSTLYEWLERGAKEDKGRYRAFLEAVEEAQASDEMRGVQQLERLANDKVTVRCPQCESAVAVPVPNNVALNAVTWKLERKYPDRYGGRVKLQVEAKVQEGVERLLDAVEPHMSRDAYGELVRAIALEMGEQPVASQEA